MIGNPKIVLALARCYGVITSRCQKQQNEGESICDNAKKPPRVVGVHAQKQENQGSDAQANPYTMRPRIKLFFYWHFAGFSRHT